MIYLCGGGLVLLALIVFAFLVSNRDSQAGQAAPAPDPSDLPTWQPPPDVDYATLCRFREATEHFNRNHAEAFNVPPGCVILPVAPTSTGHNAALVDEYNQVWYTFNMSEV